MCKPRKQPTTRTKHRAAWQSNLQLETFVFVVGGVIRVLGVVAVVVDVVVVSVVIVLVAVFVPRLFWGGGLDDLPRTPLLLLTHQMSTEDNATADVMIGILPFCALSSCCIYARAMHPYPGHHIQQTKLSLSATAQLKMVPAEILV